MGCLKEILYTLLALKFMVSCSVKLLLNDKTLAAVPWLKISRIVIIASYNYDFVE